jgi:hypothetical protein
MVDFLVHLSVSKGRKGFNASPVAGLMVAMAMRATPVVSVDTNFCVQLFRAKHYFFLVKICGRKDGSVAQWNRNYFLGGASSIMGRFEAICRSTINLI